MLRSYLDLPRRVHLLCFGQFVQRSGAFIGPFLALDLATRRGLGEAFATLTLAVFGAGALIGSLIGGHLADRFGRRPILLIAPFGASVLCLALLAAESHGAILAAVFAFALITHLYPPASQAMLADLTPEEQRPRAYALMYMAWNLGFAFGAGVGGQIAGRSFFWLFAGEAIATAVFGCFVFAFIPESRPEREPRAPAKEQFSLAFVADRAFVVMLFANFLIGLLFNQPFSTLPLEIVGAGFTPDVYGNVMALNGVMIALLQLPVTALLSGRPASPSLTIAALLLGAGFGINGIAGTAIGYVTSVVVWTMGEIILAAIAQAAVARMAPLALRASYFGAFNASFGLAMIFGPLAGGFVFHNAGGPTLWAICVPVGMAAAIIFWSLGARLDGTQLLPEGEVTG